MKNKKRVLITGSTGFIGKKVLEYFLKNNYSISVIVRKKSLNKVIFKDKIKVIAGDIRDYKSVEKSSRNIEGVIHLAALKADEKDSFDVNVIGAENLTKACFNNKVKHIIYVSTISAKLKKKGIYGETKQKAEEIFLHGKVPTTILRPSIVYSDSYGGIFGKLVRSTSMPFVPVFGKGNALFYPIHIDDLVKAIGIAACLSSTRGKAYDVVGPDAISFNDLLMEIAKGLNRKVRLVHTPVFIGYIFATILSKLFYRAPITKSNIYGATQNPKVSGKRFFKDFGFVPRALKKGLRDIFLTQNENPEKEARIMYKYLLSLSNNNHYSATKMDCYNYRTVLKNNGLLTYAPNHFVLKFPWLLGPFDAISKIFSKDSILQKKLYITTGLIECHPASANWLLPKERGVWSLFWIIIHIAGSVLIKISIGSLFFLLFFPFYKKYVN
ncbi:NAD-dependent epimerase/dehydratase family protein [Patescibacteria group bacterium]|nr:NAD-dependent epimerase/dehydratase family protein [Patescibacteria group bacterium]